MAKIWFGVREDRFRCSVVGLVRGSLLDKVVLGASVIELVVEAVVVVVEVVLVEVVLVDVVVVLNQRSLNCWRTLRIFEFSNYKKQICDIWTSCHSAFAVLKLPWNIYWHRLVIGREVCHYCRPEEYFHMQKRD